MAFVKKTPLEGNLREILVPQIFIKIMMMNLTGILLLELKDRTSEVYFRKGNVVHVKSNHPEDRFGQFLVRIGLMQESDIEKVLHLQKKHPNLRFGDVLIKAQLIEQNHLLTYLNEHHSERLYYLFEHKEGSYRYIKNSQWKEDISVFEIQMHRIYFEAVERFYSLEEIKTHIGLTEESYLQRTLAHRLEFPLPPLPSKVLHNITQATKVKDLMKKVGQSREKVFPVLFVLVMANWVEMVSDQKATRKIHTAKPLDASTIKKAELEHPQFKKKTFFEMFGLPLQYHPQKAQTAFLQLMAKYKTFEGCEKGDEIIRWIKIGYQVLSNPKLKTEYVRRLQDLKTNEQKRVDDRIFLQGLFFLFQDNLERARDQFEEVLEIYPNDAHYKAYFYGIDYLLEPSKEKIEKCLSLFEESLQIIRSSNYLTYVYAELLIKTKNIPKAEAMLGDILEKDPHFAKAQKKLDDLRFEKAKKSKAKKPEKKKEESALKKLLFTKIGGDSDEQESEEEEE